MGEEGESISQPYPYASYLAHKKELDAAISRVLEKGEYVSGEEVTAFEREFAQYCNACFGVGAGSGTEALHLALRACDVGSGDEVITVSQTPIATVAAIELCGATPVLVDIEPQGFTLDPNQIKPAVTSKTKAVIPLHLYGHPADMEPIMTISSHHGLRVVEDCAQAPGALYNGHKTGSLGDMAAFSFNPTEGLSAFGDAGMVVTNDSELAERAHSLKEYGQRGSGVGEIRGWSTHLHELQAAILRVKLYHLDEENSQRRKLAELYNSLLFETELILPREKENVRHVYHQYVVRSQRRDSLRKYLTAQGLTTSNSHAPVHLQPPYLGRVSGLDLKNTESVSREVLSLPLHPHMTELQVHRICTLIGDWYR